MFWKLCFQFCTIVTDTCINIGDRVELIPRPGQRLCADAAAASARATELIVYLLSPLPTPRTPQPGLSSIHDHNRHHLRFYREKSFGHQMVACMTRITLKLNKRKRLGRYLFIYDATVSTFSQDFIFVEVNEDRVWSHLT